MTDIDLDALEALSESATPVEWVADIPHDHYASVYCAGELIASDIGAEDAAFIAAARTAVPALVARVRELEDNHLSWLARSDDEVAAEIADLRAKLEAAERERDLLAQAMWDGWATLGFDTDGDDGPGAWVAGAGSYDKWAADWLRDIGEHRKDYDELLDDISYERLEHRAEMDRTDV